MNVRTIPADWLPHYTYDDYKLWEGDWELISGIPFAMSPSAKRIHQAVCRQFVFLAKNALETRGNACTCDVYFELDWIISESTVLGPDVMIVCGDFTEDYLTYPPVLVLEVASEKTRLKDRNVKFDLYQANGVKYYLLADPDKSPLEIFMLCNNRYEETNSSVFQLTSSCTIELNFSGLWV